MSLERSTPPKCRQITVPGTPRGASEIRQIVSDILGDHPAAYEAAVIASELATNALLHSASRLPGGRISAELRVDDDTVTISVTDDGDGPGLPADPARDGGLGLAIVGALATETGAEVTGDGRYTVWARIGPPAAPGGTAARTETGAPQPAHGVCESVPPCPAPGDDQTPEDTP
jgi:anti-sigma regulatory factor (Ser/Thr protein kinase)